MEDSYRYPGLYVPPGHFYSPLVEPFTLNKIKYQEVLPAEFAFGLEDQWIELERCIQSLEKFAYRDASSCDGFFQLNDQFSFADAQIYRGVLARFAPKKIIEVGSGWSTAVAIDHKVENNLDLSVTVYEPFPERLLSIGMPKESFDIQQSNIAHVKEFTEFERLEHGDILFIDSSHVVKTGSELLTICFEIIPRLNPGVLVHFHDIFSEFEYPVSWILEEKRSWNESYMIRALLQGNVSLKVLFLGDFLRVKDLARFTKVVTTDSATGSLWIQKI